MSRDSQIPKSTDQLQADLAALKLKIALQECRERELDRLMEGYARDEALEKRLAQGEGEMLRRIDRDIRKMHARRRVRNALPKAGKFAACLALVFYLGLGLAFAASPAVRVNLMKFFVNIEGRHASYGFEETGEFIEVPADWAGYYYPTYIPEGFEVARTDWSGVYFERSDGALLDFEEMGPGGAGSLDTENAKIDFIRIHGRPALLSEKGKWTSILWSVDNRSLYIGYTGGREEAVKIAESVRMIRA